MVWQLAHTTDEVSWKSIFAAVPPVMLAKSQGLVYVPAPIALGAAENSAGNFEHRKVSCTQRTRRIAKFEVDKTTLFRYDGGTNFQELRNPSGPYEVTTELVRAGGLGGGIGSVL